MIMNDVDELTAVARLRNHVGHQLDLAGAERRLAAEITADAAGSRGAAPARRHRRNQRRVTGVPRMRILEPRNWVAIGTTAAVLAAAGAALVALPHVRGQAAHRPASEGQTPAAGVSGSPGSVHLGPALTEAELVSYSTAAAPTTHVPGPGHCLYQRSVSAVADARKGQVLRPPLRGTTDETWWRA